MCLFSVDIWERSSTGLFASKRDRVLIGLGTSA